MRISVADILAIPNFVSQEVKTNFLVTLSDALGLLTQEDKKRLSIICGAVYVGVDAIALTFLESEDHRTELLLTRITGKGLAGTVNIKTYTDLGGLESSVDHSVVFGSFLPLALESRGGFQPKTFLLFMSIQQ